MKSDLIQVSIFCTTYNQSSYIKDAIESFLAQETSFRYEILINDDASTDGTMEIVREYAERFPNIVRMVAHTENQFSKGINNNTEFLYPIARGKYFALCEGDDYWVCNTKLQRQFEAMEKHQDATMCVHASINVDAESENIVSRNVPFPNSRVLKLEDISGEIAPFATASYFIRRDAYERYIESGYVGHPAHGDFKMLYYFLTHGDIVYLHDQMSAYRQFAKGSINSSIQASADWRTRERELCTARSDFLAQLAQESDGNMRKCLYKAIEDIEYSSALRTFNYQKINTTWKNKFKEEPTSTKVKVLLCAKLPRVYECYRHLYNAIRLR